MAKNTAEKKVDYKDILEFLYKNTVKNLLTIDPVERGLAEILYFDQQALLVRAFDSLRLHCESPESLPTLIQKTLEELSPFDFVLYVHDAIILPELTKAIPLEAPMIYYNIELDAETVLPEVHVEGLEINLLSENEFAFVREHYKAVDDDDYIHERIETGVLGAWLHGELVGFIGEHEEGTMGMLEILPHARRKGIARALEKAMVDRIRSKGRRLYGNILENNHASLQLHIKQGYKVCMDPVYWLFRPDEILEGS